MKQEAAKTAATPFEKFQALARHILTTPKSEVVKGKAGKAQTKKRK